MAKTNLIGLRVEDAEIARLKRFTQKTGIEGVTLARAALAAALDYFDANGRITLPLQIQPEQAEKPGSDSGGKK
ncbi:hypothetical protein [Verrucomicrobium sp. BvORR106]|uniref:hypothetical protein n=1 Tax=Verrucomicrobium sp. BvORR106 TaxID=1403819 RepID=UPI0005705A0E|nr:hypothetical protein [Verrucomicrobium sp. BvORR106]